MKYLLSKKKCSMETDSREGDQDIEDRIEDFTIGDSMLPGVPVFEEILGMIPGVPVSEGISEVVRTITITGNQEVEAELEDDRINTTTLLVNIAVLNVTQQNITRTNVHIVNRRKKMCI